MKNILAIYRRELKAYFNSPIAYVVVGLFMIVAGIFFYLLLSSFIQYMFANMMRYQQMRMSPPPVNVNLIVVRGLLSNFSVISLFLVPMITMRTFSEDKKIGTIELLLTSPITNSQIILGKFLAAFTLYAVMILSTWVMIAILFIYGNPEFMPIVVGYAGLLFMGAGLIAIGVLISSMTENQIVAAIGTFCITLFLWVIGFASGYVGDLLSKVVEYISFIKHFDDFAKGVFDTSHVVYYLSVMGFMLYLTYHSIESARWRG